MRAAAADGDAEPFPWEEAMHAGLSRLRLPAREFWAMTPRELLFACRAPGHRRQAPDRSALDRLMQDFPDETQCLDRRDA